MAESNPNLAKTIIKKSAALANKFQHHQIDPEHLLLAIITSENSKAFQVIVRIGSDVTTIREQIDNLFDEKYSLGNDLNAFGQRYYNPSPERNYFGGIKIRFNK